MAFEKDISLRSDSMERYEINDILRKDLSLWEWCGLFVGKMGVLEERALPKREIFRYYCERKFKLQRHY